MILLISNTQDLTTDFVVRELARKNIRFSRLNTDEFPRHGRGIASFGFDKRRRLIRWDNRPTPLDFDCVRAVLYRRPEQPVISEAVVDPNVRQFCADESYEFLRGLWFSLECFWISQPEMIRKAERKVYQLQTAENVTFRIPKTLVTNDPEEVKALFESCENGIIVKPVYLGFIDQPTTPLYIYTSEVSPTDLEHISSAELAPAIYQERIMKEYDVRVTVVGDRVFTARIDADALPSGIPDWRYADMDHLRHRHHQLPHEVEQACLELVNRLGLQFGAIDLAVDAEGNYVFFEINPNGQWAWLERALGFRISEAIVDRLLHGSEGDRE
jgi:glutathione synthase/RimK-type ligase-like ATP-grasp enzyme